MDPYLERHWGDVHHRLIIYACDALQTRLPGDLRARVEERVFLESEPGLVKRLVPDLHISESQGGQSASMFKETGGAGVAEPLIFEVETEPATEGYIEIRQRDGGKVITVIEFLSPANKIGGAGQRQYLDKQDEILGSDASLVEIDLVRAGNRVLALPAEKIPLQNREAYLACISPGWERNRRHLYIMPLREPLRRLPIPLRKDEKRIGLDLQKLIEQAYEAGRYDDTDYRTEIGTTTFRRGCRMCRCCEPGPAGLLVMRDFDRASANKFADHSVAWDDVVGRNLSFFEAGH